MMSKNNAVLTSPSVQTTESTTIATSATPMIPKVEIIVDDDDRDGKSSKKAKLATPRGKAVSQPVPDLADIDSKTLRYCFGVESGTNPPWRCPLCPYDSKGSTGHQIGRAVDHAQKRHQDDIRMRKMVALYKSVQWDEAAELARTSKQPTMHKYSCEGENMLIQDPLYKKRHQDDIRMRKTVALDKSAQSDEAAELAQTSKQPTMHKYSFEEEKMLIQDRLCKLLIEDGLSFSFPESKAFREIIDVILNLKEKGVTSEHLFDTRKVIACKTDKYATDIINQSIVEMGHRADTYGLTLLQDSRSNITMDPLIATGVQGKKHFLPLGTVNAGSNKKNVDYLVKLVERHLGPDGLGGSLADHIIAICLGGASANISAMKTLREKHSLITIRCQSHALSLVLKKMFLQCFPDVVKKASVIFDYVRKHQRLSSPLKSFKGLVLFRFIDTRVATHVVALQRLLELKSALTTSLTNHDDFKDFKRTVVGAANKRNLKEFESVLADTAFWEASEFAVAVGTPITVALRLMDSHMIRAQFGFKIWSSLGNHLAAEMAKDEWSDVAPALKTKIYDIYVCEWRAAHYPVLSAAFVLDPANRSYVAALSSKVLRGEECPEYESLIKDTTDCLALVIERSFPLDSKEQLAKKKVEASKRLMWYLDKCGEFADIEYHPDEDADMFWVQAKKSLFVSCARKLLFVAITISDVERLHKVYSLVHTSERNRMDLERVDLLAQANLILREKRRNPKPEVRSFKEWASFFEMPGSLPKDLVNWTSSLAAADMQVASSLQETFNGSTEGAPSVVDVDPEHPFLAIEPDSDGITSTSAVEEEQSDEEMQTAEVVEATLTEEEEDASARAFDPCAQPDWLESEAMRKSRSIFNSGN